MSQLRPGTTNPGTKLLPLLTCVNAAAVRGAEHKTNGPNLAIPPSGWAGSVEISGRTWRAYPGSLL